MNFSARLSKVGRSSCCAPCVDRLAGEGQHTISAAMKDAKVKATYRVAVRDSEGTLSETTVEVRYKRPHILPPMGKQKKYPPGR